MRRRSNPHVYFIRRADGEGPIKIGCSQSPITRLQALACWAPYRLALLAQMPGDETLERRFHAKFVDQHSHSEWFFPSAELEADIAAIARGNFDPSSLPPPRRLATPTRRPWTTERLHAVRGCERLKEAGVAVPARFLDRAWWRMDDADKQALVEEMKAFVARYPRHMTVAPSVAKRSRQAA